jgi:hypothetical protein
MRGVPYGNRFVLFVTSWFNLPTRKATARGLRDAVRCTPALSVIWVSFTPTKNSTPCARNPDKPSTLPRAVCAVSGGVPVGATKERLVVRRLMWVAVMGAVFVSAVGCASHKDRHARAKGAKVPLDRSVLTGVAAAPAPAPSPMLRASYLPASPYAAAPVTPAYVPTPAPVAPLGPQFVPADPSDYAAARPAYASAAVPPPVFTRTPPETYGYGGAATRPPAPAQPTGARFSSAAGGGRYQVQKGDTLFGIARTRYGDGKRWQQIAAANPGLSPATLQAGATIVVP